jgi:lipopolysaccharide/colanic/teichoic acid biosynthesis glycosyltransferase
MMTMADGTRTDQAKRAFDLLVGGLLALAALPFIVLMAVAVAISLRCWPFFVHERIGTGGRTFKFPKLRTLPPHTPRYTTKYGLPTDVPALCRFLRKSHLDELPQLFLVPLGQLSLVGPRPKMPDEFEPIEPVYGRLRTTVPQGCTGLWQIGSGACREVRESPEFDLFYIQYASVRFDVWILWRTLFTISGLGRQVELADVPQWVLRREPAFEHFAHITELHHMGAQDRRTTAVA